MTSTLSPTSAAAFSDQQLTGQGRPTFITPLATGVSVLPVRGRGTIYCLNCDKASSTDNSDDN